MTDRPAAAPHPSYRLIPSRFPPIGLFDTVATAADLAPVMELAGWTNDRLVAERLARLPQAEWVYGRPNASVVMAAFLHAPPDGSRFSASVLGAWYASAAVATAVAEVAHHLRREMVARNVSAMHRTFRCYTARLRGRYLDIRGRRTDRPELYAPDHLESQRFGEAVRTAGRAGIVWDSLRHAGGTCVVAYRPRNVVDVVQAEHFRVRVTADDRRIEARRLP